MNNLINLYFKVKAAMMLAMANDPAACEEITKRVRLSNDVLGEAAQAVVGAVNNEYSLDAPTYMFADKPVTPSTWIDIQAMRLDTYPITDEVALLVDPVTREYCYVYWDEAAQCSNPYPNLQDALNGLANYMKHL